MNEKKNLNSNIVDHRFTKRKKFSFNSAYNDVHVVEVKRAGSNEYNKEINYLMKVLKKKIQSNVECPKYD